MTIKALTFDLFGTVVDWRSSVIRKKDPPPNLDFGITARNFHDLADQLGCY